VQTQLSNKHKLVLYKDRELVEKTRNLGFNLSKTFENHLKQLLTQFSTVNSMNNTGNNDARTRAKLEEIYAKANINVLP
jgi:post-segregation antitoxin (ccd killing protein)